MSPIRQLYHWLSGRSADYAKRLGDMVRASWEAAGSNRLTKNHWSGATSTNVNQDIAGDLAILRQRSEAEARNNGFLAGMIETYAADVVGDDGPRLKFMSDSDEYNKACDALWLDWFARPDLNDKLSGAQTLKLWVRSLFKCGEYLCQKTNLRGASTPLELRILTIHPARLTQPFTAFNPYTYLGIRFTPTGKPLGYTIQESDPAGLLASFTYTEIPADQMIHGFRADVPGQLRGVPWLASVLDVVAQLREFDADTLQAARSAAMLAVLLTAKNGETAPITVGTSVELERGTMTTLPPGYEAMQVAAQHPNNNYSEFRGEKLCEIGRAIQMPLMMVKLDSSKHNYSSARFDNQLYLRGVRDTRKMIESEGLDDLLKTVRIEGERAGLLPRAPRKVEWMWVWPNSPHVDPMKEAEARDTNLKNGTLTFAEALAADGKDSELTLTQLEKERPRIAKLEPFPGSDAAKAAPAQGAQESGGAPAKPPARSELVHRDNEGERKDLTLRTIQVRADSINLDNRSIEAVMSTETPALIYDWRTDTIMEEIIRMAGVEYPEQVPLLADHNRFSVDSVLGSVRSIRTADDQLIGRAFFATDSRSESIWTKVREKHVRDVSIGYRVSEATIIKRGESLVLDGKKYTASKNYDLRIATKTTVKELSVVPFGADPSAKFRGAAPSIEQEISAMTFEQWLAARGINAATLTDAQRAALKADFDAIQTRAATPPVTQPPVAPPAPAAPVTPPAPPSGGVNLDAERAAAAAAERTRITAIREAAGSDMPADLVNRAVNENMTVDQANTLFLGHMRRNRPAPIGLTTAIQVGADRIDGFRNAVADSFILRHGARLEGQRSVDATQFRNIGLKDLARLCLRMEGQEIPFDDTELFQRALSTVSLPNILGAGMNKVLNIAYDEFAGTLSMWTGEEEVPDFKVYNVLRLGKFANTRELGEKGHFEYDWLDETKETMQVKTYAKGFGLTRKQWINDDLGAFITVPQKMGDAAARTVEDGGYDLLTSASGLGPTMGEDGVALFNASRTDGANYATGTGTALSAAALDDMNNMLLNTKENGAVLNLLMKYLIVPPAKRYLAMQLTGSAQIQNASTTDTGTANPNQNLAKVIVEPRLTSKSTKAYYGAVDPRQSKTIVRVYLRGNRVPQLQRKDPTNTLGIGWLLYHDYGTACLNWRGIAKHKGEA